MTILKMKTNRKETTHDLPDEVIEEIRAMAESRENGEWVPKEGEKYWLMDIDANIFEVTFLDTKSDRDAAQIGNRFRTKEEAEKAKAKLIAKQTIRKSANFWKPNWADVNQTKYHGFYDHLVGGLAVGETKYSQGDTIYFPTKEMVEKSQAENWQEWIDFLGVED